MNYRHAFHAGNFADVVKHAMLARIVTHLRIKDAAFRIIDTHAGAGRYNLSGDEATRGGEWQDGIGRVWQTDFAPEVAALLAPYLDVVRALNASGPLSVYPGSPLLIRAWLRPQDRLIACELESGAAQALVRNLRGDARVKPIAMDGWTALMAHIPPKERRGLVLIDPSYEEAGELTRLAEAIGAAHRKWQTGMLLAWYPIKDAREIAGFIRALSAFPVGNALRIELVRDETAADRLRGTGLIALNPPWTLENEIKVLLPALARAFSPAGRSSIRVERLPGSR